jgi:hypothetical protein
MGSKVFQVHNYKNISNSSVILMVAFFLYTVVFIHPIVSYSDWCLVHSYDYNQEISSHSGHVSEHLLLHSPHHEDIAHIEQTEENCVADSGAFIQPNVLKSPELRVAIAYVLRVDESNETNFVGYSFLNDVKNAPSHHLSILRSIVVIV